MEGKLNVNEKDIYFLKKEMCILNEKLGECLTLCAAIEIDRDRNGSFNNEGVFALVSHITNACCSMLGVLSNIIDDLKSTERET